MKLKDQYLNEAKSFPGDFNFRENRQVGWKSPSNIALIKYWGKRDFQLPQNPSLSFSLKNCFTETSVEYSIRKGVKPALSFSFEGKSMEKFRERILDYLDAVTEYLPFLKELDLQIESVNSFPHSSGIASSASSMSALALCLVTMEKDIYGNKLTDEAMFQKASFLARIGSGSAARSVYGGWVEWGSSKFVENSSDEVGIPLKSDLADDYNSLCDAILITSSGEKKKSSRRGHGLMTAHPFAETRYKQARENLGHLLSAMQQDDDNNFIRIAEQEALTLHAMMMTSEPGFTLMNANSWKIIDAIRNFREKQGVFATFTLDAGPNVHLIYKNKDKDKILNLIENDLIRNCENDYWIDDRMGNGPEELN